MVARAYDNLGGVQGLGDNKPVPYSSRGNDKNRFQTFTFKCSKEEPFSGKVEFQGSVNSPTTAEGDIGWSTLASLDFYGERDTVFLETQVEATKIRVKCSRYDEQVSVSTNFGASAKANDRFKIGTIEIFIDMGIDLAGVKAAIDREGIVEITTSLTQVPNSLIITKNDGTELVLEETIGTPLQDLGIFTYEDAGVVTLSPKGKIKSITGMR